MVRRTYFYIKSIPAVFTIAHEACRSDPRAASTTLRWFRISEVIVDILHQGIWIYLWPMTLSIAELPARARSKHRPPNRPTGDLHTLDFVNLSSQKGSPQGISRGRRKMLDNLLPTKSRQVVLGGQTMKMSLCL